MFVRQAQDKVMAARLFLLLFWAVTVVGQGHMNTQQEILITDLRSLIAELGKGGGQISASVYDTAQALRYAPPDAGVEPALAWLKSQQQMDGGWGNMAAPLSRDVPTLAAILTLHTFGQDFETKEAVQTGMDFLWQSSYQWQPPLPEDLPVGVELILPQLLCEARDAGLNIDYQPYEALIKLGARKREIIRRIQPKAGTAPVFSWEAWGTEPETAVIDHTGGVGHSPAATAYWLKLAADREELSAERRRACEYLKKAAASTGLDIPGIVPTAWPIDRFEQVYVLHTLQMAGLLDYAPLREAVQVQTVSLANNLQPHGLGFSDYFEADGDDTLAAVAVLTEKGYEVDPGLVRRYQNSNHFLTYPFELQPSASVTARGLHVLNLWQDNSMPSAEAFLMARRTTEGYWSGDKWNTSWFYMTYLSSFVLSLSKTGTVNGELKEAANAILRHQNPDGGWSTIGLSNFPETAYSLLTLQLFPGEKYKTAVYTGYRWMLENYSPFATINVNCWLNKQDYRPNRVDRGFELAAMLSIALQQNGESPHDAESGRLLAAV